MDTHRFDQITRFLAHRTTRRSTFGVGVAGLGLASATLSRLGSHVGAQDATPSADPNSDSDTTAFLFVQIFESGTFAPHPDQLGVSTVTLSHGTAQTVYFSDRPERIVGSVPTQRFLDGLGFSPDNPPNAALVTHGETEEDIIIVELLNPRLTEAFGPEGGLTVTYDVRVIENYQADGLRSLAERRGNAELPASFGATSVFIDDCSDQVISCCQGHYYDQAGGEHCNNHVGDIGPVGFCWEFGDVCCKPCESDSTLHWGERCNAQFAACNGDCQPFLGDTCW